MSNIVVILQARTASTRLPGKVLLPLAGIPLVVLAARRAANTGLSVIVATSDGMGDDLLATTTSSAGFSCVRGSEENVLERFLLATQPYSGETLVVRLTADNTFPDGEFIGELCGHIQGGGGNYLGTQSPLDGLPYGLSAEVFRLQSLRDLAPTASSMDREHVTSSLRVGCRPFRPADFEGDLSDLRCTVDCLDDYQRVAAIFAGIDDPVRVSWRELVARLHASARRPRRLIQTGEPVLVLGTAQLGLPNYGRTNLNGRPKFADAVDLVRAAVSSGITAFDTARAYGEAEHVLGEALVPYAQIPTVISKLDPLVELEAGAGSRQVRDAVDASVFRTCHELRRATIPTLLLHRWSHRHGWRDELWGRLRRLQSEGVIGRLGASVSTPEEARAALRDPEVQHLQLPLNILDSRWVAAGIEQLAAARPDVVVHARSVFLQGLLLNPPSCWPRIEGVDPESVVERLDQWVMRLGRRSRMDLCLGFVRAHPWIHGLVLGVDSLDHLCEIIVTMNTHKISSEEARVMAAEFSELPESFLNPAKWPLPGDDRVGGKVNNRNTSRKI